MKKASNIDEGLERANKAFQKKKAQKALLIISGLFFLSLLTLAIVDMVQHLTPESRIIGLICLGLFMIISSLWWIYQRYLANSPVVKIAQLLERLNPRWETSLVSLLEMREQSQDPQLQPITRRLAGQAVRLWEKRIAHANLDEPIEKITLKRFKLFTTLSVLIFFLLSGIFYKATWLETLRYLNPYGNHPPYSMLQLEIIEPQNQKVVYGESILVRAKVHGGRSKELYLSAHPTDQPEQIMTLPMFDQGPIGFNQILENIKSELKIWVHTADQRTQSEKQTLPIVLTPKVTSAQVILNPPAYTAHPPKEQKYEFGELRILEGTRIQFTIESNRPLRSGHLIFDSSDGEPREIQLKVVEDHPHLVRGGFTPPDSGRLKFKIQDIDGYENSGLLQGSLTLFYDRPPDVSIPHPQNDAVVTNDYKLIAQINATDDIGIAELRIHRAINGLYSTPKVIKYSDIRPSVRENLIFNIPELGIDPGDQISFFVEVIDNCPDPHLIQSRIVRLSIIDVKEYNEMLRREKDIAIIEQKYQEIAEELQELSQEQRELEQAMRELVQEYKKNNPNQKDQNEERFNELLVQQQQINHKAQKLSERMNSFGRNQPLYDLEKSFQKSLQQMGQNINQAVQNNRSSLIQASENFSTGSSSTSATEDMANAAQELAESLDGQKEEIQNEIVETIQDLSKLHALMRSFNYFKYLYNRQFELTEQVSSYNVARSLSRTDTLALKQLASEQRFISNGLKELIQQLITGSKEAEHLFPKAASSARALAQGLKDRQLVAIANKAAHSMLLPDGPISYQLAERCRREMESFFSDPQTSGMQGQTGSEADTYLSLCRSLAPGQTAQQMGMSSQFGNGGLGQGQSHGQGQGSGSNGYSYATRPRIDVFGHERSSDSNSNSNSQALGQGRRGHQGQGEGDSLQLSFDQVENREGLEDERRDSRSVLRGRAINEYEDLVNAYFKMLLKQEEQ